MNQLLEALPQPLRLRLAAMRTRHYVMAGAILIGIPIMLLSFIVKSAVTSPGQPQRTIDEVWFYDLNDGNLVALPEGTLTPTRSPSAPDEPTKRAVRAHVFGCGDCGPGNFIAYLTSTTPNYRAIQAQGGEDVDESLEKLVAQSPQFEGLLHASADNPATWFTPTAPETLELLRRPTRECEGKAKLVECFP